VKGSFLSGGSPLSIGHLVLSASPFSGPRRYARLVPVHIPVAWIAALSLARDHGLCPVCLILWFFNNDIGQRMLVREPVYGIWGQGKAQLHLYTSLERTADLRLKLYLLL
jgi:hypothetical protein